jgi:hypothetical protein
MATLEVKDPIETKGGSGGILAEKAAAVETKETEAKAEEPSSEVAANGNPIENNEKPQATDPNEKVDGEKVPQSKGPLKEPLARPLENCQPEVQPELTPEMLRKYEEVLAAVKEWTEVPISTAYNAAKEPLTDDDRIFLTRDCVLRYLRASKGDVPTATKRLMATLTWRREYGILGFSHDYISPENET